MPDCSICQNEIKDKVQMTCKSLHEFCFECIMKNIEYNKVLKCCPLCRGSRKYIIISEKNPDPNGPFYSLGHFVKSLRLLSKISKYNMNTCLVPDKLLLLYSMNKKQLDFVFRIAPNLDSISDTDLDEIVSNVKWNILSKKSRLVSYSNIENLLTESNIETIAGDAGRAFIQATFEAAGNDNNANPVDTLLSLFMGDATAPSE